MRFVGAAQKQVPRHHFAFRLAEYGTPLAMTN
jgi:hypothetical protein